MESAAVELQKLPGGVEARTPRGDTIRGDRGERVEAEGAPAPSTRRIWGDFTA